MLDKNVLKESLTYAGGAVLYVSAVALFMQNADRLIGPDDGNALAPVVFLLLLVVSAATMAMLVFGKPVMLYLDGKKREAVAMVISTIGCLAGFVVVLLAVMSLMRA